MNGLLHLGMSYSLITQLVQSILIISIVIFFAENFNRESYEKSTDLFTKIVLIYAIYQFFARIFSLPFAFLPVTNPMISLIDEAEGFQRGYRLHASSRIFEARVSSFFVEPGHLGFYGAFVYFSSRIRRTRRNGLLLLLLSQSLGAYVVTILVLLLRRLTLRRITGSITIMMLCVLVIQHVETSYYFLSRLNLYLDGGWEAMKLQARFASLPQIWEVVKSNIFLGTGLAAIKSILPDETFSVHYLVIIFERGILGFCIYFGPFFLARKRSPLWLFTIIALLWKPYVFYAPLFLILGIIENESNLYSRKRPQWFNYT